MYRSFVFPYGITLSESGEVNTFPAAQVLFQTDNGEWISLFLVIDSGARISALPKGDASSLGVVPEDGTHMRIKGVGEGMIPGWRHDVTVRIGGARMRLPVVFLDQESAPRVLGRERVFNRFTVVFEEAKRRSGFLGKRSRQAQVVTKLLDSTKEAAFS